MADKAKDRLFSNLIISIGTVLVVLAVLVFAGLDARSVAQEALTSRTELNAKTDELNKLAQLREEAKLAEPKLELLEDILPERDDLFTFAEDIEALGTEHDINATFNFGSENKGNISYNLSAIGSYDEIINFVEIIGSEVPFMSISGIDVIILDNGYRAAISGKVFFNE